MTLCPCAAGMHRSRAQQASQLHTSCMHTNHAPFLHARQTCVPQDAYRKADPTPLSQAAHEARRNAAAATHFKTESGRRSTARCSRASLAPKTLMMAWSTASGFAVHGAVLLKTSANETGVAQSPAHQPVSKCSLHDIVLMRCIKGWH